ncbi:MAG: SDR family NAD(P)-dependent oxidoreductase [Hyphomonadaceae bacterium]
MTQRLAGRRAIITGAASGIGLATAKLFAQEGAMVLAVDLPGDKLVQAFEGSSIATCGQSVTDPDAPDQILDAARRLLGGVDILFNNAGIATNSLVERTSDADWDQTLDVNLRAMFRLTRAAIPDLKASAAGRIINTASVMAEGSGMGLAAYSASKSGVQGFTRAVAIELGKYGVTANWLLPGAIRTGMTQGLWDQRPEIADTWANKAVLRRLGEPDDIAKVALFLASADAGFITGQGLCVDGGLSLRVGG